MDAGVKLLAAPSAAQARDAKSPDAFPALTHFAGRARNSRVRTPDALSRTIRINIAGNDRAQIAGLAAGGVVRTGLSSEGAAETGFSTRWRRAGSTGAGRAIARFGAVAKHIVITKLQWIGGAAATVEYTAVRGAEFSIVAMRMGQTLNAGIIVLATKTVGPGACTACGTRAAGTIPRYGARLTVVVAAVANAALC